MLFRSEILVDEQLCGWPEERVEVLLNQQHRPQLITELRRWARETTDVLIVYFVGHGIITPQGELCLALTDTALDDPDVTGLEYRFVRSALIDSPARIKVVILDCCYSGRAIQAMARCRKASAAREISSTSGTSLRMYSTASRSAW